MSVRVSTDSGTEAPRDSIAGMKLEVVVLPVSEVDRAKCYEKLGWRLDADFATSEDFGVVQHEQLTGEEDAEWPSWYAGYMVAERTGEGLTS